MIERKQEENDLLQRAFRCITQYIPIYKVVYFVNLVLWDVWAEQHAQYIGQPGRKVPLHKRRKSLLS